MTTALAPQPAAALLEPTPTAPPVAHPTASNRLAATDTHPRLADDGIARGRQRHKASRSTTFLSSPSPSPNARRTRGPPNPVRYVKRVPEPLQSPRHVPEPSQSRPHPTLPFPLHSNNSPKALVQPDVAPSKPTTTPPKRKRRSSSLNNSCLPTSVDSGCMSALLGGKQPARKRSSSSRGRSRNRNEERNSLLEDFQGYEREDSPRTTVSKRMSDLGLLDTKNAQHRRGPSGASAVGSDVMSHTIDEEKESQYYQPISHQHVASQQSTSSQQPLLAHHQHKHSVSNNYSIGQAINHSAKHSVNHSAPDSISPPTSNSANHSANQSIDHFRQDSEGESESRPSEPSDRSQPQRALSPPAGYSLFPAANDTPVSPISPTNSGVFEYGSLSQGSHSPKRQKRSPSPPLGPRPVSPSRSQNQTPASNFSRKGTAPVPKHARPLSRGSRRRTASPPLTAGAEDPLTWHDSEITGHLMLDPDDDGTGINGVGFKPTKIEEQLRRIKRKQQVEGWKAREGKADRDERMARRNMTDDERAAAAEQGEVSTSDEEGKRTVHFAEG